MHSTHTYPLKWAVIAALMIMATVAKSQIRVHELNNAMCFAASPANEFAGNSGSHSEFQGYLNYRLELTNYRARRNPQVWGDICVTGFSVGFIALAVSDLGYVASTVVGSNSNTYNSARPSYLTPTEYSYCNIVMVCGLGIGVLAALLDFRAVHRYALTDKTKYIEKLCFTRQGYPRFRMAGSRNKIGLGISL